MTVSESRMATTMFDKHPIKLNLSIRMYVFIYFRFVLFEYLVSDQSLFSQYGLENVKSPSENYLKYRKYVININCSYLSLFTLFSFI